MEVKYKRQGEEDETQSPPHADSHPVHVFLDRGESSLDIHNIFLLSIMMLNDDKYGPDKYLNRNSRFKRGG